MLPRELYIPAPGPNISQRCAVSYTDGELTRVEVWSTETEGGSDAPREHKRRVSHDNGRTWSPFEDIESAVNQDLPGGGIATSCGGGQYDTRLGILYQLGLRRLWPGMPLYTYAWGNHEHKFNDHVFVRENGGPEKLLRYEDGPEFDPDNPFDPAYCENNRAYPGAKIEFTEDGTAYYPFITYMHGADYSFNRGGVRVMRRDPDSGEWNAGEAQYISLDLSSRGLLEPDVAVLRDGSLLIVCRGSDSPTTPGRKWMCTSEDRGRTLSPAVDFRYDDGSQFYSPSSFHQMFRSTKNGLLYWLANICEEPPHDNGPRHPLYIAEIDEEKRAVKKDSLVLVDKRREGEPNAVQLSNWSLIEDRETLDIEFYLSRIGQNAERFWESGVYKYTFVPPA